MAVDPAKAGAVASVEGSAAPWIILASFGTTGDILPFLTIAVGLQERGHRVLLLAPRLYEPVLQACGLRVRFFGTDEQVRSILDDPALWDERRGFGVAWRGVVPHLDLLREMVAGLPATDRCVVLCHPLLVPAAVIARAARPDLRIVSACLSPATLRSCHDLLAVGSLRIPGWLPMAWRRALWQMVDRAWIDPFLLPGLNACRRANGLPPVARFFDHMLRSPDASIGLFPSWFGPPQPDWPASFLAGDFPGPLPGPAPSLALPLERFLSQGEAPIAFTPGTGHRHATGYFEAALEAMGRMGRRGLFITPHAAQVPKDLPSYVLWQAHAPFRPLLPRLAALAHHGGIGTTAEAFRAGIPQLIVPYAFDQFDNALRARNLGVAELVPASRLTASRLQARLTHLIGSPEVTQARAALAGRIAAGPGAGWLLDRIEFAAGID